MSCERKARHSKSCPSVSWPNFPRVVSETLESRSEQCRQIVDTVHRDHEVLLSPCGLTKGRREKTQVASVGRCSRPRICAVQWPQDPGWSQPPAEPHLPDCGSQSCPISPRLPQCPPPAPPATSRPAKGLPAPRPLPAVPAHCGSCQPPSRGSSPLPLPCFTWEIRLCSECAGESLQRPKSVHGTRTPDAGHGQEPLWSFPGSRSKTQKLALRVALTVERTDAHGVDVLNACQMPKQTMPVGETSVVQTTARPPRNSWSRRDEIY